MRSLEAHRSDQEYQRLRSRVATLEYDVARLRERLDNHDHDDELELPMRAWEDRD